MNLNKAMVLGRLTRDPEVRALPSGQSVVNFGLATNRVWTDRDGNKQEATEFHNIVAFGRLADVASQYLNKGALCLIVGRLQTRTWDKPDGSKGTRTEIVAEELQLGPKSAGVAGTPRADETNTQASPPPIIDEESQIPEKKPEKKKSTAKKKSSGESRDEINPEDIPF